jgi:hypothetical protein
LHQIGYKEEQPSELGSKLSGAQVKCAQVGDLGSRGARSGRAFLISASGQLRKTLLLQDETNGSRAEAISATFERFADVVNGEILFAQGDDLFSDPVPLGCRLWALFGWREELAMGILAEVVAEHPETSGGIAEALGNLLGREPIDEICAQGLVLPVS